MKSDITVTVGGRIVPFHSIDIDSEIGSVASTASANLDVGLDWDLALGERFRIFCDSTLVFDGYLESLSPDLSSDRFEVMISGRSRTGDLVDCCLEPPAEFRGSQLLVDIVQALLKPFGLEVNSDSIGELNIPVVDFKVDPGEKIVETLRRLSELSGAIFIPASDGKLCIQSLPQTKPDSELREGKDFKECFAFYDQSTTFSTYIVRSSSVDGKSVKAVVDDHTVSRYRPASVIEPSLSMNEATSLASWRRATQRARSMEVSLTLPGWKRGSAIWQPNDLVTVIAPSLGIPNAELVVGRVVLACDREESGSGTTVTLSLTGKDGFQVKPDTDLQGSSKARRLGYV